MEANFHKDNDIEKAASLHKSKHSKNTNIFERYI